MEVAVSLWQSAPPEVVFPSAQRKQHAGGACLQDPSYCRYKAYILLINVPHARALSAASSVGLVAQCGMAPWGRHPQHSTCTASSLGHLLHLLTSPSPSSSLWTESCTHIPSSAPEHLTALLIQLSWPQLGTERAHPDQELPLMRSACLETQAQPSQHQAPFAHLGLITPGQGL